MQKPASQPPTTLGQLPRYGFVRMRDLCRTPTNPVSILPISEATFWRWVKDGFFPPGVRLGSDQLLVWPVEVVAQWLADQAAAPAPTQQRAAPRRSAATTKKSLASRV